MHVNDNTNQPVMYNRITRFAFLSLLLMRYYDSISSIRPSYSSSAMAAYVFT